MAGKNWIAGAIKNPGALHKATGTPMGQNIPKGKLKIKVSDSTKMKARKRLAQTLASFSHKGK